VILFFPTIYDGSVNRPEHELNRGFISDPLHFGDGAAVTPVPLVDEVLSENIWVDYRMYYVVCIER